MDVLNHKVEKALEEVRPFLQQDGGDIELIEIKSGVVTVRFTGFCSSCSMTSMTLNGIDAIVKERVPEIKEVVELVER